MTKNFEGKKLEVPEIVLTDEERYKEFKRLKAKAKKFHIPVHRVGQMERAYSFHKLNGIVPVYVPNPNVLNDNSLYSMEREIISYLLQHKSERLTMIDVIFDFNNSRIMSETTPLISVWYSLLKEEKIAYRNGFGSSALTNYLYLPETKS